MTSLLKAATVAIFAIVAMCAQPVQAQQQSWLQIEAQPNRSSAQRAASRYAGRIQDVRGFRLGSTRWYAIVIGPFDSAAAARAARRDLRRRGLIPGDAFINDGAAFRDQFWPIGAEARDEAARVVATPAITPDPDPEPVDETPAEARRSERQLTRAEREELQTALRWAGFYDGRIDAAFGRGTRSAMRDWQAARGYDPTGVLTTRQRAALLSDYNAILEGLDLEPVTDDKAGITILMPTAQVGFDKYAPPFVHYGPNDPGAHHRVLLISQQGDRATLHGLYDIMQTLEIVPDRGVREKTGRSFTLVGKGEEFVSHTEARLRNGNVKGFTLIWPTGDEKRRLRLLDEMRQSFSVNPGVVMDDMVGDPTENQSIDLLAGLKIKQPALSRSGFYIDRRGAVLTSAEAVENCERITLNEDIAATIAHLDPATGLALLKPGQALAPRAYARLQPQVPRLQGEMVAAGYSYEGALGAPSLTYGKLAALRGLQGEKTVKRLEMPVRQGDIGGPVLDPSGAVIGMLVPAAAPESRTLPEGVSFAVDVDTIRQFLLETGVTPEAAGPGGRLPTRELTRRAAGMTVLVGCWR